jgi:hypothetical protein
MKKYLFFVTLGILALQTWSQNTEYIQQKDFQAERKKIYESINAARKQLGEIRKADASLARLTDSLMKTLEAVRMQTDMTADSLFRTGARLGALQEKVDAEKQISKGAIITGMAILLILMLILFLLILRVKKITGQHEEAIAGFEMKMKELIEPELRRLQADLQAGRESLNILGTDLGHKITSGLVALEGRNDRIERQVKEEVTGIGIRVDSVVTELGKAKDEQTGVMKDLAEKFAAFRKEAESGIRELTVKIVKAEEELLKSKRKDK